MLVMLRRLASLENLSHLNATFVRLPNAMSELIDGTIFKIRRPTEAEDAAYNGWKRIHATKYQAVALANFMIGDYGGPHACSGGDGNILRRSNVEDRLRAKSIRLGMLWFLLFAQRFAV
eukprot:scaffold723_cov333-Pavlova_lutheri.AAC.2